MTGYSKPVMVSSWPRIATIHTYIYIVLNGELKLKKEIIEHDKRIW